MSTQTATEADVWEALRDVPDPEIPTVSLVDLGVIAGVELGQAGARVLLMPTFLGCPAIEIMRDLIRERVGLLGLAAQVEIVREPLWSSDRITEEGRRRMEAAGIAPPAPVANDIIAFMEPARCPHCGSRRTTVESAFGPTLCRAIAHCRDCNQPFEQFKPL